MQGFQIVVLYDGQHRWNADRIDKDWRPDRQSAEDRLRERQTEPDVTRAFLRS